MHMGTLIHHAINERPDDALPPRACEFLGVPLGTTWGGLHDAMERHTSPALRDLPWVEC